MMILGLVFLILSFATSYLSMLDFSHEISASSLESSYLKDVTISTVFYSLIYVVLLFFLLKFESKIVLAITILVFIFFTFLINLNVFIDRVSSWSSFSFEDEVISVVFKSYVYVIISVVLLYITIKKNSINNKSKTTIIKEYL